MKTYSTDSGRNKYGNRTNLFYAVKDYVLSPLVAGLFGFFAFFCILIVTKFFSYIIGTYENVALDWDDAFLSSIGFILVFLIRFLENFNEEGS
jgi:hypothetical protein